MRGPLTRRKLIENGIECPEIYGDPALLMPYLYKPNIKKTFKYGFIAHYADYNLPQMQKIMKEHPEILYIKFRDYKSWKDVLDQICSCECIMSSLLHGLIISDAYNIPNVRVVLSKNILGGDFKYKDYFGGVGREYREPIELKYSIDLEHINRELMLYKPIVFDGKVLLSCFPFLDRNKFRKVL